MVKTETIVKRSARKRWPIHFLQLDMFFTMVAITKCGAPWTPWTAQLRTAPLTLKSLMILAQQVVVEPMSRVGIERPRNNSKIWTDIDRDSILTRFFPRTTLLTPAFDKQTALPSHKMRLSTASVKRTEWTAFYQIFCQLVWRVRTPIIP